MFSLKLDDNIEEITSTTLKFKGKPMVVLPNALKQIANLSRGEWYSIEQLQFLGFVDVSKIEDLLRAGILCIGCSNSTFPFQGRLFYETQFPKHAASYPLRNWLCSSFPINTIWIGLPFCHLTHIRHSTALGLANVIDDIDGGSIPFLGVLPYMNPSNLCIQHLCQVSSLVLHTTKRLGILGGDHRVAWAVLRALRLTIQRDFNLRYLHIDAHHDLYGPFDNIPLNAIAHSNFLISLLTEKIIDEVILIGCRDDPTPVERAVKQGFPIKLVPNYHEFPSTVVSERKTHTHLSVDFDILDPAIAPNVSSPIKGGWSLEQLKITIQRIMQSETIDSISFVEIGPTEHLDFPIGEIISVMSDTNGPIN